MDAANEVKARLNVEDVVSGYIQLKRAGRNLKGLSPFTNEKTPSFIVSPEKQIWHDFSSGHGGDIFTFIMEMEGLDFRGALELLARQAGVELEQYGGAAASSANKLKPRLLQAHDLAAHFYQRQLVGSKAAIEYLTRQRGFNKKTILEWRLGYAPNTTRGLTDFLVKKGYSLTEIRRAGLAVERRGQTIDMFRGRIMIPLADAQGQIVGFTARLLLDLPEAPKYINTPQTPLYDKSRHVYGLHLAKAEIRKQGFVVVAEGNLDVITSHQAEVTNVVASAGTAMTKTHLMALKRFSSDVRLSFDSDQAGLAAAERIIPLAQSVGVNLKLVSMPSGAKDPDELIRTDPKLWQKAIAGAKDAPDWLISRYQQQLDLGSAQGKREFTDILLGTLGHLSDAVEQEHYLKKIAKLTDTSLAALNSKLGKNADAAPVARYKKPTAVKNVDRATVEYHKLQDHLLAIAYGEPAARWLLKDLDLQIFKKGASRALATYLSKNEHTPKTPKLPTVLRQYADYVKIMELQFEELYLGLDATARTRQATLARDRLVSNYVNIQKNELVAQMQNASGKELTRLIEQADRLNELIKQAKG